MKIQSKIIPITKWKLKCPYSMKAECIVIHNTDNDASARNEIAYMSRNDNPTSFHYAVDDIEVIKAIYEKRNAWHAGDGGNGKGNRTGIGIEICYSKSGGERFKKAEINASKLVAKILKRKGWGIDRVKRHKDFSGKNCPARTMKIGWKRFLNMCDDELKKLK